MDAIHTNAMFQHISPREELLKRAKALRKAVYTMDPAMKEKMPKKRERTGFLEDQIAYGKELQQPRWICFYVQGHFQLNLFEGGLYI